MAAERGPGASGGRPVAPSAYPAPVLVTADPEQFESLLVAGLVVRLLDLAGAGEIIA